MNSIIPREMNKAFPAYIPVTNKLLDQTRAIIRANEKANIEALDWEQYNCFEFQPDIKSRRTTYSSLFQVSGIVAAEDMKHFLEKTFQSKQLCADFFNLLSVNLKRNANDISVRIDSVNRYNKIISFLIDAPKQSFQSRTDLPVSLNPIVFISKIHAATGRLRPSFFTPTEKYQ